MALILDAYNVLHCTHVLPERWATVDAHGLCDLIDRSGFYRGGPVHVVCDGAPKKGGALRQPIGNVELIYAGGGCDADSLIERMVEVDHHPRDLVVVSNDNRVRRAARKRRGRAVPSETFLRGLAKALERAGSPAAEPEKPAPSADDVALWMQKFGLDTDDADDTPAPSAEQRAMESETDRWMREFGFEPDPDED